jgi:hypothetical protein
VPIIKALRSPCVRAGVPRPFVRVAISPHPRRDQLAERRFEFIPFWGFLVFLLYSMRRVDCRRCQAVVVEEVPWGDGKRTLTKAYMLFLARWARRLFLSVPARCRVPAFSARRFIVRHRCARLPSTGRTGFGVCDGLVCGCGLLRRFYSSEGIAHFEFAIA